LKCHCEEATNEAIQNWIAALSAFTRCGFRRIARNDAYMTLFKNSLLSLNMAALILGAANLLSRILGMLRNRLLAGHFGASRELDMYLAAFQIPDFLFVIFLVGAASAAIIPVFLAAKENDGEAARIFIYQLLAIFASLALVLSLAVAIFAPSFIHLVTPGFTPAEREATVRLTRIMMASPVFLGLSGILASVMQAEGKFLVFAISPILYNIGIIAGILFFLPTFGLPGLALGVILGAVLHFASQIPAFLRLGFSPAVAMSALKKWRGAFRSSLGRVAALSLPRVLALSMSHATFIALIAFASRLNAGSISVFQFAFDLYSLPVGIFGVSYAVAAYPGLCDAARAADASRFAALFKKTAAAMLFWIVPFTIFTFILRSAIVRLVLGSGRFSAEDAHLTAAALGVFAIAIVLEPARILLLRAFYAIGNTRKPLIIGVIGSVATLAGAFLFLPIFENRAGFFTRVVASFLTLGDIPHIEIIGLALTFSFGLLVQTAVLVAAFVKEAKKNFSAPIALPSNGETLKILLAVIGGGFACVVALHGTARFIDLNTFRGVLMHGSIAFFAGFAVYAGLLYLWGNQEVRQLAALLRRKTWIHSDLPREFNDSHH